MNSHISQINSSASIELMAKAQELRDSGVEVIGLGGGEPNFDTPDVIKKMAIKEIEAGNTHYAVGKGILPLRNKIKEKLKKENGITVTSEEIIVTPGAKMGIYLAVRSYINTGDEVLIPTPSWVSYSEIVRASGGVPVLVELDAVNHYEINEKLLQQFYTSRTKMLIINTPNNPTGRILTEREIGELISFSKNKDIVIISDEVYEKITFDGRKNISLASYELLKDKTITVNSFSKTYAMTGWRLGYLAGRKKYIDNIYKLYSHTITGVSPFLQKAAMVALDCESEVEEMRKTYEKHRNYFIAELNKMPGVYAEYPEGAFYAWVKFDIKGITDSNLANYLLDYAKVIGVPGKAYNESDNNYIRLSFANSIGDLENAIKKLRNIMR